jgi:hypothetical protein
LGHRWTEIARLEDCAFKVRLPRQFCENTSIRCHLSK